MISVKGGTKTWAQATTGLDSTSKTKSLSPKEREQALNGEDLGTVLNKVADPNWIDPAKRRKVGNNQMGKDAFLKLLLTQLKNQDPTNPMESHDMAAQLAQFTSLEKLTAIDEGITSLAQKRGENLNYDALNMMGMQVSGDSSKILRLNQKDSHDVVFQLSGPAQRADVRVRDGAGNLVQELSLSELKVGENKLTWNGKNQSGETAAEGEYSVTIEARDMSGKKVPVKTQFFGQVTGVNYTAQGPVLMLGNKTVRLKDVRRFSRGEVSEKKHHEVKQSEVKKTKEDKPLSNQLLEKVGLSAGMRDKLLSQAEEELPPRD